MILEPALEMARQTRLGRAGETASPFGFTHPSGQLQQPQRVSPGLGDDPVAHPLVQVARDRGRQQRPRVLAGKPFYRQRRQARK